MTGRLVAAGLLSAPLLAQFGSEDRSAAALLPRDREVTLALSAGPEHITKAATVYALERGGFVKVREGTNGFTCLVVRDHPQDLAPVCHDPEGTETVVPRLLREAELRAQGKTESEVRAEINEGLRTGRFRPARRVGLAYMLSTETMAYVPEQKRAVSVRPHVMSYAPYLRSADIGARQGRPDDQFEYPIVISEGEFNAYIVAMVTDGDRPVPRLTPDPTLDELARHKGRLPALLPRDREIALAESAGPPHVARDATVYVLQRGGFAKAREGSNGFACLVERGDTAGSLYPQCFDPEGAVTLLTPILRAAELREQGKSKEEIDRAISAGFRDGRFRAPRRTGVCYMLSTEGRFETPTGGLGAWAPHAMIYAPYIRAEDVGAIPEDEIVRRLPTLHSPGTHGYIVVTAPPKSAAGSH